MQSRRDQLQAYKFLTRRALAALVVGEPDVPEAPMRRLSLTTITGIMAAVLVVAGFAVFGLVRPGTNVKLSTGTIYIERETGAQFVLLGDGQLHPALNYTSAVLAITAGGNNQGKVAVKTVAASTLAHKEHGYAVGIDDIPPSLPRSTSRLVKAPVTVCSKATALAADNNIAKVTVTIGGQAGATPLRSDEAVLVSAPGGQQNYMLWNGRRLQIGTSAQNSRAITTALNLGNSQAITVGTGLLNALPQGTSLVTPKIPDAGSPGPPIGNVRALVGQLIQITDNHSFVVVLNDGIAPVTQVMAGLLETLPLRNGKPISPIQASQATVLGLNGQSTSATDVLKQFANLPSQAPHVPDTPGQAGGVCAVYHEDSSATLAVPPGAAPTNGAAVSASQASLRGEADEVDVPAEKASLITADQHSKTVFVIAAPGKKFAASPSALGGLGYGSVSPLKVPEQLLQMLPNGPALDTAAVRRS